MEALRFSPPSGNSDEFWNYIPHIAAAPAFTGCRVMIRHEGGLCGGGI
jgi:hypothetical protein